MRIPFGSSSVYQPWHYDQRASYTMSLVLHNETKYDGEGKGLDISFNQSYGPFSFSEGEQIDYSSMIADEETAITLPYPLNGAILFASHQGHLLHRMSTITQIFSQSVPCTERTTMQIMLIDEKWGTKKPA